MQPSPLQLRSVKFIEFGIKTRIEPDISSPDEVFPRFDFNKTLIITRIEHAEASDDDDASQSQFLVKLKIELSDECENPPPYLCNVECVGYFAISKKAFPDPVKRLDVGVVNGASLLYGVIRERIADVTARSWYGELLLPSGHFADSAPSEREIVEIVKSKEKKSSVKARSKKKIE